MGIQIPDLPKSLKIANLTATEPSTEWYRIQNVADGEDTTEIHIYDSIGGWMGLSAQEFIADLKEVKTEKISLHINSPGGSVFEGIAIHNAVWQHPANVTVYVDALAASIASVIAMAGDEVVMVSNSQMMIHDAMGITIGNAGEMREYADLLDRISDNIASMYSERAGGTAAEWRERMRAETWYSPDEAVDAKLANRVHSKSDKNASNKEDGVPDNRWDLSIFNYAGRENAPAPAAAPAPQLNIGEGIANAIRGAFTNPAPSFDPDELRNILKGAVRD